MTRIGQLAVLLSIQALLETGNEDKARAILAEVIADIRKGTPMV